MEFARFSPLFPAPICVSRPFPRPNLRSRPFPRPNLCSRPVPPSQDAYLQRVIVAASEGFLGIVKGVRATVDKRNRKLIDHDRWLTNVKKAQEANDKAGGAKIAEVTKAESQFELARQDYEAINNKIKEEMPMLMAMRPPFVDPILQTIVIFSVRARERTGKRTEKRTGTHGNARENAPARERAETRGHLLISTHPFALPPPPPSPCPPRPSPALRPGPSPPPPPSSLFRSSS